MKRTTNFRFFLSSVILGLSLTACRDQEPNTQEQQETLDNLVAINRDCETDNVVNTYNGSVALIDVNSNVLSPYFMKRMGNNTTEITPNTEVVLLSETGASQVLNNEALLETLQKHWRLNKPVGVLQPSENALRLFHTLDGDKLPATPSNDFQLKKEKMEAYAIYMLKSDGNAIAYLLPNGEETVDALGVDSLDNHTEEVERMLAKTTLSEHSFGNVADQTAKWLNDEATKSQKRLMSVATANNAYDYSEVIQKIVYERDIDCNWIVSKHDLGTGPGNSRFTCVLEVKINAGYDKNGDRDIYDIQLSEHITPTYFRDHQTKKKAAYKYAYSGGNNLGPRVKASISAYNHDVYVTNVVPYNDAAATYSATHTPPSMSVSAGINFLPISGCFNFNYTPASTSISVNKKEIPLDCHETVSDVEWYYGHKNMSDIPRIYTPHFLGWGFNPSYNEPFASTTGSCKSEQAVTFYVNNTHDIESSRADLLLDFTFKVYHNVASPFENWYGWSTFSESACIVLPKVNRYFDRYTPYCYASSDFADMQSWNNLEAMLRGNVNYKLFYNEDLEVAGTCEFWLKANADLIWEEAIESLIKQYDGRNTVHEYVIGLANTSGEHLKAGLHIKDGKWEYVKDIHQVVVEQK